MVPSPLSLFVSVGALIVWAGSERASTQPLPRQQSDFFDLLPIEFPGQLPEPPVLDPVAGRLATACVSANDLAALAVAASELHSFTVREDGSYDLTIPDFHAAISAEDWNLLQHTCEVLSRTYMWTASLTTELRVLCPSMCTGSALGSLVSRTKLGCQSLPPMDTAAFAARTFNTANVVATRALSRTRQSITRWCDSWSGLDTSHVAQAPHDDARAAAAALASEVRVFLDHAFHFMSMGPVGLRSIDPLGDIVAGDAPAFHHIPVPGQRWDVLRSILEGLAVGRPANSGLRIAEIGVEKGMTVAFLMQNVPAIQKYVLVDPWHLPDKPPEANAILDGYFQNLKSWAETEPSFQRGGSSAVQLMRMSGEEAAGHFAEGYFDLVFIDAGHTFPEVQRDIAVWRRRLRPDGGVLAGHDFSLFHPAVALAVLIECGPMSADAMRFPLEEVVSDDEPRGLAAKADPKPLVRVSADSVWWCVRRERQQNSG